jgi:thiamine-monophosphate kinase
MESEFIRWLRDRLPPHPLLALGPGDDAAILRWGQNAQCMLTVDMLTEGIDFELSKVAAARVGRKALAVSLSDLAAMAARPLGALVALALPRDGALALAQQLYEGLIPLAEQYQLAIAGGDTNTWDGPLVISTTLVGEVTPSGPLLRGGAQPGDSIVVTGRFGGSLLGHQFDFEPRVQESLWLKSRYPLHAGIDVSDGLSLDLWRLAEESGCGAELDVRKIPLASAAFERARQLNDGSTALDHALGDGEDFELILAVPPQAAGEMVDQRPLECGLTRIGRFVAERGLWQIDESGARSALTPRGFEH